MSEYVSRDEFKNLLAGIVRLTDAVSVLGDHIKEHDKHLLYLESLILDPVIDTIKKHPEVREIAAELRANQTELIGLHYANISARLKKLMDDASEADN